ncbi:MAG: DsrE family protein [Bacteroidetes bacterium]|nr:DsrE family protein [Bacteroidota bacterium]
MNQEKKSLYILWTSGDAVTAEKMVLMYGHNALLKGWWEDVTIVIWGASAALVAESEAIQKKIGQMMKDGVDFSACKACADQLGASETLKALGVEVKYWGVSLTDLIKEKQYLITI